ncbi:MAG: S9 family peptidase [Ignavibacteriales bacterium]|nr:MAG: S9 family peptidase [Ignavibacteriales bacterium]
MKRNLFLTLLFFVFTCSLAAQKRGFTIEDLYDVKNVGSPVISPSGNKIAFAVVEYNLKEGASNSDILILYPDGATENISSQDVSETDPFWGSDNELYFLSKSQVHRFTFNDRRTEQVTDFAAGVSAAALTSDKKSIVFVSDIYSECGADNFCNKNLIESDENGPVQAYMTDKLLFRHWTEYSGEKKTSLLMYNLESDYYQLLTESAWLSGNFMLGGSTKFSLSPDGKEICYMFNPEFNLAASTNSDLFVLNLQTQKTTNLTKENKAWDGYPLYSPNGFFIAFKMQTIVDFEADRYRLAVYNRSTKGIDILTENFDYSINDICWGEDSETIYFTADKEGYSPLHSINIHSKAITPLTGKLSIFGFDATPVQGTIYYVARAVHKPGEIYRMNMNDNSFQQMTSLNQKLLDMVDVRPAEQMWVEGADGIKVHVFIVKPHNFDAGKKYPLILNVHGGPQSQWMDSFRGDWQVYPGAGYIVAFPNPHGSTGYGSAYTEAISGDWGGKVYEDLMKVTDALEQLPYVDKDRIGAMGWSYGGYMMNWFQVKTKRFKCLASMMGVYDLESMWGATEEVWFPNWDLKGQPWNSDNYEKFSPSNFVQNFSTPTLIITGERDYRVPYTQSVQYFTTLQTLGIDSRLIIFPNDGHWPNNIKSMPLYYNAHLEWFHKYLGGGGAPYDSRKLILNTQFK